MCLQISSNNSTVRNKKKDFFLLRYSFLLAGSSFWLRRSRTTTSPLVALLSAVLLRGMKWVATYSFRVRPNWLSVVAQWIGINFSDVTRFVARERIQKEFSLLKSRSVVIAEKNTANTLTMSILI